MILLRDVEKESKEKIKPANFKVSSKENVENLIHDLTRTKNELTLKIKRAMTGLFKERDYLTFPKPQQGSFQHPEQINQDFYNNILILREKVEKDVPEKVIFNTFLNTRMVCSLLQSLVDVANQNGVFDMSVS